MSQLTAHQLGLSYRRSGRPQPVLQQLDVCLQRGETLVALGPSGCGKSSLLNVLAGLLPPDDGDIRIDGQVTTPADGRRGVVFQDPALLPWLNALDNLVLGLRLRGLDRTGRRRVGLEWLARVGLAGLGDRRIGELSGGQRQRLGLARALAIEPAFLLLDEPFAALDAATRQRMQLLLLELARRGRPGLFLITHQVEEALLLGTELWLLQGPPLRILQRLRLPFSRRHAAGESRASILSDPQFLTLHHELLQAMPQRLPGPAEAEP